MKYLILTCALFLLYAQSNAQWAPQPTRPKQSSEQSSNKAKHPVKKKKKKEEELPHMNNTVFVEFLGAGTPVTVNYQRNFYLSKRWDLGVGIGISPVLFQTFHVLGDQTKFAPMGVLLTQSLYKLRKGGEFGFGLGLQSRVTYREDILNNGEIYKSFRHTAIGEFGYGQVFGKHIYSGIYTYVFVNDIQVYGIFGVKVGYSFGKKKTDY